MKEWFEEWFDSPYYHQLYQHRSDDEANLFVKNIVNYLQPTHSYTLLDLACGKGRHSLAFRFNNLDVTGLDLSENSILHAKQFEDDMLHFYVHDMRHTFRTNYYNIVCNLFTSFGYFKTPHDNVLAARSMASALKQDGKLIIDFVNQQHARKNIDANRHEIIKRENVTFDLERNYTEHQLIKKITILDGENTLSYTELVNSFSLDEMNNLFTNEGLTLVDTFGDYHLSAYDAVNSPRMILVLKK